MEQMIAQWYAWGFWTAEMVQHAVPTLLTQEQCNRIIHGKDVDANAPA